MGRVRRVVSVFVVVNVVVDGYVTVTVWVSSESRLKEYVGVAFGLLEMVGPSCNWGQVSVAITLCVGTRGIQV